MIAQQIWEKSYPEGVSWGAPLPDPVAIESWLHDAARKWPDSTAVDFYGRTFTYRQLFELACRAAAGFQRLGVGPGTHVGLHLLNTPHYVICFFGALMAGGRVVNFSPAAGRREVERQVADSQIRVMVTLGLKSIYPQAAASKGLGHLQTIVVCGFEDFLEPDLVRTFGPAVACSSVSDTEMRFTELIANEGVFRTYTRGPLDDEIAVIQYTGGTGGQPKGALLTHANFSALIHVSNRWASAHAGLDHRRALIVVPLFHVFGLGRLVHWVSSGTEMVIHARFDPDRILQDLANKKVTTFSAVPTMYAALINHPKIKEVKLSALRTCASGGAPLPIEVQEKFFELTGVKPREGYGLTETTTLVTRQRREPRPGTVGLPAPRTLVEVVDLETGLTVLPAGECGEICVSGPQVMKGYWNRPQETEDAFRGGRFHTGDIGYIDPDGYLILVDRKKDMILSGGYNVYPRIVEAAICEHPDVAEAAVIGVPDCSLGQVAKAFLVMKAGCGDLSYEDLVVFLSDRLSQHEIPLELELRDALPKTAVGKVMKKNLFAEEAERRSLRALAGATPGE